MKKFFGYHLSLVLITLSFTAPAISAPPTKEKIRVKDLLAKHLESIGTPEARSSVKSIMSVGTSKAVFKGRGSGIFEGIAVLASSGKKNMIGMKFNNPDYQFEKMGYDGSNLTVGYAKPGVRSVLGGFLRVNEKTFKRGIIGGVLSTSWELLDYREEVGRLKYAGKAKKGDSKLYKFDYNLRKGSDLSVTLFFDAETFRHVKTVYRRVFTSGLGRSGAISQSASARVDNSARQSETRHKMIEEFGGFRQEQGLMLPHTYSIYLEIQTGNGNTKDQFSVDLQKFYFNQPIEDNQFRVDAS